MNRATKIIIGISAATTVVAIGIIAYKKRETWFGDDATEATADDPLINTTPAYNKTIVSSTGNVNGLFVGQKVSVSAGAAVNALNNQMVSYGSLQNNAGIMGTIAQLQESDAIIQSVDEDSYPYYQVGYADIEPEMEESTDGQDDSSGSGDGVSGGGGSGGGGSSQSPQSPYIPVAPIVPTTPTPTVTLHHHKTITSDLSQAEQNRIAAGTALAAKAIKSLPSNLSSPKSESINNLLSSSLNGFKKSVIGLGHASAFGKSKSRGSISRKGGSSKRK